MLTDRTFYIGCTVHKGLKVYCQKLGVLVFNILQLAQLIFKF